MAARFSRLHSLRPGLPLLRRNTAAEFFPGGMVGFVGEHPLLGAAAATAFLTANLLHAGAISFHVALLAGFDLVEQQPAGKETVQPLLARDLAFDPQPSRTVQQHHAGGRLVHILAAVPARTDKGFLDVNLAHTQRAHALRELDFLFRANGEGAHYDSVAGEVLRRNEAVIV